MQDAAVAGDARAALEWIAGEPGRVFITQERIQGLCWYELPVKWFADPGEKLRVVAALAGALDLLQLLQPAGLPAATAAGPLAPLRWLRHFAQDLGLARRPGRKLTLTARGRRLLAGPGSLWRTVAAGLPGGNHFTVFAGELFLALLLAADSVPGTQIKATVGQAVAEEGFRVSRTGELPDEHHIGWAVHETSNLCRALGLLAAGGDWRDRSYGLTGTGQATALVALRARATGREPSRGDNGNSHAELTKLLLPVTQRRIPDHPATIHLVPDKIDRMLP